MKYIRFLLPIFILFLTIGYAAQNITLSITGDAYIASDIEDFDVYISNISQNGTQNLSLLKSSNSFAVEIISPFDIVSIDYEVTNNSANFDALVTTECYNENDIGSHKVSENTFEEATLIESKQTKIGTIVAGQEDSDFVETTIVCDISAIPVERQEYGEGEVPPSIRIYRLGEEITIGGEKFNVLKDNGDSVMMLAQYNLGTDYLQSTTANLVKFSEEWDHEYFSIEDGELVLEQYGTVVYEYITNYITILSSYLGNVDIEGTLLSYDNLIELGCIESSSGLKCYTSQMPSWFSNNQTTWLAEISAEPFGYAYPEYMTTTITIERQQYYDTAGVRPVITIPKSALKN